MLDMDMIGKFFRDFSGETETAAWSDLLRICAVEIEGMLRPDADLLKAGDRLCYAAAALAFYRYSLKSAASDVAHFKAGEVTLAMGGGVEAAYEIYKEALRAVRAFLNPDDFAFICI